jgi:dodecin
MRWQRRHHADTSRDSSFYLFSPTLLGNNGRMSDHVYKKIEVVGSSPNGFEEAIKNALARAEKTVHNMRWFEVTETRGDVENGKVAHWQVTLKIGFTLEE